MHRSADYLLFSYSGTNCYHLFIGYAKSRVKIWTTFHFRIQCTSLHQSIYDQLVIQSVQRLERVVFVQRLGLAPENNPQIATLTESCTDSMTAVRGTVLSVECTSADIWYVSYSIYLMRPNDFITESMNRYVICFIHVVGHYSSDIE